MFNNRIDHTGHEFGKLRVLGYSHNVGKKVYWLCLCDCGKSVTVFGHHLRRGAIKSCGCYRRSIEFKNKQSIKAYKHGYSKTSEYAIWAGIIKRCENINCKGYVKYGGRGIKVCPEWRNSFEQFIKDMGPRPPKHSIDRIDTEGNYEPSNCRWATSDQQANNRKTNKTISFNGLILTISQWSKITGIKKDLLQYRLAKGWKPEYILTQRKYKPIKNGAHRFT